MAKDECNLHSTDIAILKKEVEDLKNHNKEAIVIIETGFKELNAKVRKLEDRSLIGQFLEKILWLAAGAFITVLVNQNYIAVNNKDDYRVEKQLTKKN